MAESEFSRLPQSRQVAYTSDVAPVVLVGAAFFDIKGRVGRDFHPGSSNAGVVRLSFGGAARNIAENLARLDAPTVLLTAIGDDGQGRRLVLHTRAAGVGLADETLIVDRQASTGSYLALLQADGQLVAGVYDTAVLRSITPRAVHRWHRHLRNAALVVADANLRPQTLAVIAALCRRYGVGLCLDPVSVALAGRIRPHLRDALLITPNMREAAALSGLPVRTRDEALAAARALQESGPEVVVVTMAHGGAVYASADASGHVLAVETDVFDATGAGDALTAGVLFGLLNDFPLDDAIALGTSMASLTMLSSETVRSDLTLEQVYQHLKL